MIRIRLGIVFLRSEQIRLERPVTIMTERPITNAPFSCTVTASEEQIPRTRTEIGLPLNIGFKNVSLMFPIILFLHCVFWFNFSNNLFYYNILARLVAAASCSVLCEIVLVETEPLVECLSECL